MFAARSLDSALRSMLSTKTVDKLHCMLHVLQETHRPSHLFSVLGQTHGAGQFRVEKLQRGSPRSLATTDALRLCSRRSVLHLLAISKHR